MEMYIGIVNSNNNIFSFRKPFTGKMSLAMQALIPEYDKLYGAGHKVQRFIRKGNKWKKL